LEKKSKMMTTCKMTVKLVYSKNIQKPKEILMLKEARELVTAMMMKMTMIWVAVVSVSSVLPSDILQINS